MTTDTLLACGSFWPREGGAERQMRSILGGLANDGCSVAVVTQALPGLPRRETLEGAPVRIYRVGSLTAFAHAPRLGQVLFLIAATVRVFLLRPRVIVSLQFGIGTTAATLVARAWGSQHVIRLTGGGTSRFRSEPLARAASPVGRRVVRLATSYPRAQVVAPARHLLSDMQIAFPTLTVSTRHMPNGVKRPRTDLSGLSRSGVVWYARAGTERSTKLFLEIAALCPQLDFIVIGQTFEHSASNVSCIGWRENVYEVLRTARVVLNTSENEGMPNFALQAVAAGCHVVGVNNAGLTELREDFPDHVSLFSFGSPHEASRLLARVHGESMPGPGEPTSSDAATAGWRHLLAGVDE